MKKNRGFLTGLVTALVIFGLTGSVVASNMTKTANLQYMDIKIELDGESLVPKDVNGNVVEPFIISGTTYLPVRALANALDMEVDWVDATCTVVLDSNPKAAGTSAAVTPAELFEACSESVVHVTTNNGGGTGFFIEKDVVVTNNHVISGATSASVVLTDGRTFEVTEVIAHTENPDLALLRVNGSGTPAALSAEREPIGEPVYTIGAPMGIFPTMTDGMVANNRYEENGTDFYLATIGTISGNSGGPVFNSDGEVIGVVQGGISDGNNSLDMIIQVAQVLEMDRSNPVEMSELTAIQSTPDEENYIRAALETAEEGQLVSFGHYEQDGDLSSSDEEVLWIVTEREGDTLTLMSLYCLDVIPFLTEDGPAVWEDSYARAFLNDTFYNSAFSVAEQAKILSAQVKNEPNQLHGTSSGADTVDKVYLPSLGEVMEHYGITTVEETWYSQLYAQATPYTISKGVWLELAGSSNCWWWLRSAGGSEGNACEVGSGGYLSFNGTDADGEPLGGGRAIRPMIQVNVG